ncbi:hypothetical protein HYALB_00013120 [Hymenoscyphus albidus]|uniref:Uncharacterized protein n=1 Tax=Hymenoscyphus albidus TaxID=595503 RepID=A0A9N9LXY0_9HELO|nr:hypothetical protein HYALB_00013120 [Hymenoscyphus albidus]
MSPFPIHVQSLAFVLPLLVRCIYAQAVVNGQIFTPGIVLVDAPQPNTPLGGDILHVALDVTSNGQLQLPPYPSRPISAIHNVTIFLSSYDTGKNFTVSNGTAGVGTLGIIMDMEPGSTVKHINWVWPDCLVGDGNSDSSKNSRGAYNISIRQNFRLNDTDMYTIFDLPIHVTNGISPKPDRPACNSINNPMIDIATLNASANSFTRIPGSPIKTNKKGDGLGSRPEANPEDGLGGAGALSWYTPLHALWMIFGIILAL